MASFGYEIAQRGKGSKGVNKIAVSKLNLFRYFTDESFPVVSVFY